MGVREDIPPLFICLFICKKYKYSLCLLLPRLTPYHEAGCATRPRTRLGGSSCAGGLLVDKRLPVVREKMGGSWGGREEELLDTCHFPEGWLLASGASRPTERKAPLVEHVGGITTVVRRVWPCKQYPGWRKEIEFPLSWEPVL